MTTTPATMTTSTTLDPSIVASSLSAYFSAAASVASLYSRVSSSIEALPTGSSKSSDETIREKLHRRDLIELSTMVDGAIQAAEAAALFVPGGTETELAVTLGPKLLTRFHDVKTSLSTVVTGLKTLKSFIPQSVTAPKTSLLPC
jgi:hypothetical protein